MFKSWPKIPRYENDSVIITEKIDGTNACLIIEEVLNLVVEPTTLPLATVVCDGKYYHIWAQSRTRLITPTDDNYGFAKWVVQNQDDLIKLGHGYHFGEWWGKGVQRGYGMPEKKFSLFNAGRWTETPPPACCSVVPILYQGKLTEHCVASIKQDLIEHGSIAAPDYPRPEGFVIYYTQSKTLQKVIIDK